MYEALAKLGIESDSKWDPETMNPAVREAIQKGLEDGRAEMKKLSEGGIDAANFFGTRKRVGTNYMDRALGVYMGIFGNVKEVSVYLSMPADAEFILKNTRNCHGFYGASSMERLPTEIALVEQTKAFKALSFT